ncbi:hypothetical protein BDW62DRAFT_194828 [Aspergillus aurantiobrunneus]
MSELPQYYRNTLEPVHIDRISLQRTLQDLRAAVLDGVKIIESGDAPSGKDDGRGIFTGELGIALAYLRLARQAPSLAEDGEIPGNFWTLAAGRIPDRGPDLPLKIGGLSPLPSKSPVAAVVLRILHQSATGNAAAISAADVTCLSGAVDLALSHGSTGFYHGHDLGADEVLFGRAGLLWALLNIRSGIAEFPAPQRELLDPILHRIPRLLCLVIGAGREGSAEYVKRHGGKDALPLMWKWMSGHYGIGWAHGLTGIIPVILACRPDELTGESHDYLPEIGQTITALCRLCIAHNGHVPTTIPPRSSSHRESPLVQICHGAPAILGLLGCAMKSTTVLLNQWEPEWEHAARLATDRVWEEGLLSKGGGLCHGIAGNAWPLLLLHDAFEYNSANLNKARENCLARDSKSIPEMLTGDFFLSRALAMLLLARETQPYNQSPANEYRMPDHPYSLFEGLAGTVCAWAETCAVVSARIRKMEVDGIDLNGDAVFRQCVQQQLGFPCLGGNGATGVL